MLFFYMLLCTVLTNINIFLKAKKYILFIRFFRTIVGLDHFYSDFLYDVQRLCDIFVGCANHYK